jgi:hypothetical protein
MTTPPPLLASRMARTMTWTFRPTPRKPPLSAQPQGGVTEEDLSEPLPELSNQFDQSRLDEEEDTQATVEEARRGKAKK